MPSACSLGKLSCSPSLVEMVFRGSSNKSSIFWKSSPATDTGDWACSGSMVGDNSGVVRVLDDDDELLGEDGRLSAGESEPADVIREDEEQNRGDGASDASDVVGLTPRCAMLGRVGECLGRRAISLKTTVEVCAGGTSEVRGEIGRAHV